MVVKVGCCGFPKGKQQYLARLPLVDPFATPTYPGPLAYFRLHGKTGYRYTHTDQDMEELVESTVGREEAYIMFNNISMWEDACRFLERLDNERANMKKSKRRKFLALHASKPLSY